LALKLFLTLLFAGGLFAQTSRIVFTSWFDGDIQAAANTLPRGGGEIRVDVEATISQTVELRANVAVLGLGGASVTMTNPGRPIFGIPNAANVTISGLTLRGGSAGVSAFNAPGLTIRGNVMEGWSSRAVVIGANTPNLRIIDNRMVGGVPGCIDGVFVEDVGPGLRITGNTLDTTGCVRDGTSGAHGIAVHTFAGSVPSPWVTDNSITQGGSNFAIEIGAFGRGQRVAAPVVRGNAITLSALSNGGISLSTTEAGVVDQNIVDLAGFAPMIMAIEIVDSSRSMVAGNVVRGGGADARSLIIDSSSDCNVSLNRLDGLVMLNNSGTVRGVKELSRNTFVANTLSLPSGTALKWKVIIQCNTDGCTADRNTFAGNRGFDTGTELRLQPDNGVITATGLSTW
jgi:hypothetical protein